MRLRFSITANTEGEIRKKAEAQILAFAGGDASEVSWSAEYDVAPIQSFQREMAVAWQADVDATVEVKRA